MTLDPVWGEPLDPLFTLTFCLLGLALLLIGTHWLLAKSSVRKWGVLSLLASFVIYVSLTV